MTQEIKELIEALNISLAPNDYLYNKLPNPIPINFSTNDKIEVIKYKKLTVVLVPTDHVFENKDGYLNIRSNRENTLYLKKIYVIKDSNTTIKELGKKIKTIKIEDIVANYDEYIDTYSNEFKEILITNSKVAKSTAKVVDTLSKEDTKILRNAINSRKVTILNIGSRLYAIHKHKITTVIDHKQIAVLLVKNTLYLSNQKNSVTQASALKFFDKSEVEKFIAKSKRVKYLPKEITQNLNIKGLDLVEKYPAIEQYMKEINRKNPNFFEKEVDKLWIGINANSNLLTNYITKYNLTKDLEGKTKMPKSLKETLDITSNCLFSLEPKFAKYNRQIINIVEKLSYTVENKPNKVQYIVRYVEMLMDTFYKVVEKNPNVNKKRLENFMLNILENNGYGYNNDAIRLESAYTTLVKIVTCYRDYVNMLIDMDMPLNKETLYPDSVEYAHDKLIDSYNITKDERKNKKFEKVSKELAPTFNKTIENYAFVVPKDIDELKEEGKKMRNCIASYAEYFIKESSILVFVREIKDNEVSKNSIIDLEINLEDGKYKYAQRKAFANSSVSSKYHSVLNKYLKLINQRKEA